MRFLSLFSGIEAASVAWKSLGWQCAGVCEIEGFPCEVLATHYPDVPNLGDVTKLTEIDIAMLGHLDIIIFGSPCQDLSVAGKRQGFADGTRSSLFFTAMQIVQWAREHCGLRFALWENVPGAFTSNAGRDFAAVVEHMAGLDAAPAVPPKKGWGTEGVAVGEAAMVEWAVLDAQWFGVAQRRRRVFALADFGDWASRPPVLLEPEGVRGDSAPSRSAREDVTGTLAGGARKCGGFSYDDIPLTAGTLRSTDGGSDVDHALAGHLVAAGDRPLRVAPVASSIDASYGRLQGCSGQDLNHGHSHLVAFGGNDTRGPIDVATCLRAKGGTGHGDFESETFIAFDETQITNPDNRSNPQPGDPCHTLPAAGRAPTIAFVQDAADPLVVREGSIYTHEGTGNFRTRNVTAFSSMRVRRLTPRECERLQDFPDDYTAIQRGKKPAADGPRYKALGNSMAVPVIRWIGTRIEHALLWN